MQMQIKVYRSETVTKELASQVSSLLHESFEERRSQGIDFKCGHFSADDVINEFRSRGGFLLIASEDDKIVGTLSLIEREKGQFIYASHDNLAISSSMKGKGVARRIFEEALRISKENNYDFLVSFTAVNAISSVKYHRRVGFIIYAKNFGINYDSYSFIYPITRYKLLRSPIINRPIYAIATCMGYLKNKIKR